MKSFCVLNMLPSKAAGESIGAALSAVLGAKVGFMCDESAQAQKLMNDAAQGVVNADGSALKMGCGFEAQVKTLINHYSLDAGVYVGGGSGCLMSVYDCSGKPLDSETEMRISAAAASGTMSDGVGNEVAVNGSGAYFRRILLSGESFENLAFCVESKNNEIKRIFNRLSAALNAGRGELPKFFVSASGLCVSALDEEGCVHTGDELLAVCCACKIAEKQNLNVGFDAPEYLDGFAEREGVSLSRSFGGGSELWQNDGLFLITELLKIMSAEGTGLAQLCRSTPNVVTRRKIVEAKAGLSALADMVECEEVIVDSGRGAFTRLNGGTALLTPCRSSGRFCVEIQAASVETADELCDSIEKVCSLTKNNN